MCSSFVVFVFLCLVLMEAGYIYWRHCFRFFRCRSASQHTHINSFKSVCEHWLRFMFLKREQAPLVVLVVLELDRAFGDVALQEQHDRRFLLMAVVVVL